MIPLSLNPSDVSVSSEDSKYNLSERLGTGLSRIDEVHEPSVDLSKASLADHGNFIENLK